jgi:hypothetical protein
MVRVQPRGERVRRTADWAEPVWPSPLGVTDWWAQAISPIFDFDLIWFNSKTLKEKP